MKKYILLLVIFISFLSSSFVFSEGLNIAVVDLDRALRISNYSLKQYEILQADENYKQLIEKINGVREEIESIKKDGETKSLTWSESQKQEHVQKGQAKVAEINNLANQELNVRRRLDSSIHQELTPQVEKIVNDIIEEKSIGLLLKSQSVHFYTPTFDITEEIVKRLNAVE
ncbi:Outer membrane protein H precursor [gamma proteobacterium IMCC1989]|nr:Outer membrane protein H precursor [gamma proteobacterium IMCC1989]